MEIAITSRYDVLQKLQEANPPYQSLISLNEPGETVLYFDYVHTGTMLPLFFYDLARPVEGFQSPTVADAREIIQYTRDEFFSRNSTRMLIHCHAGISRSSAAAIIAAKAIGLGMHEYIPRLAQNNNIHPNSLMLKLAGEIFGGGFFEQVKDILENTLEGGWNDGQEKQREEKQTA